MAKDKMKSASRIQIKSKQATSLVSMKPEEKQRFKKMAEAHGLSLSAFFRLAANEYIANHKW